MTEAQEDVKTNESEQPEVAGGAGDAGASKIERVDEDGLPLDRPATLDDVRGNAGSGRAIAVGCTLAVAIVLALFWLIRAGLLG